MVYLVLLALVVILTVATGTLAVFVIEAHRTVGLRPLRRWRIALSKRNEIQAALAKSRNSDAAAKQAYERMKGAQANAEKATATATQRVDRMGSFIIAEQCGEHIKAMKANNYHAKEKKILRSIDLAAQNGYHLPEVEQNQLTRMLKQAHEAALRAEEEKQRQSIIKEQIREEERAQREYDRAIRKAEEERKLKEREANIRRKALEEAISLLGDTHSDQIEEMKLKLAEAQAEAEEARGGPQILDSRLA